MAPRMKKRHAKQAATPSDVIIIDESSDSDRPLVKTVVTTRTRITRVRKGKKSTSRAAAKQNLPTRQEFLKILESLSKISSEADVEDYIADQGFEGDELERLKNSATAIANLFRVKESAVKAPAGNQEAMEQYYIVKGKKSVMIVAPIETFKSTRNYTMRKVLGFLRRPGEQYPLLLSFSGFTECAEAHPRLIDSSIWTAKVMEFATNHGHSFRGDGFDKFHKKPIGTSFASHVETKLMMAFACGLLTRRLGEKLDVRKLYKLHELKSRKEAEILIPRPACEECQKFQHIMELVTGIKFSLTVCKTLGFVDPVRDKRGYLTYPNYATESYDPEIEDDAPEPELEQIRAFQNKNHPGTNVMVVLKSKIPSIVPREQKEIRRSSKSANNPGLTRAKRQYEQSDDDEEYSPCVRRRKVQRDEGALTITPQTKRTKGLATPDSTPRFFDDMDMDQDEDENEAAGFYSMTKFGGRKIKWT
jgi:hypothetical protein